MAVLRRLLARTGCSSLSFAMRSQRLNAGQGYAATAAAAEKKSILGGGFPMSFVGGGSSRCINRFDSRQISQFATPPSVDLGRRPEAEGLNPSEQMNIVRPLSPHLPVYKPQSTSTLSIFHRISGAYLSTFIFTYYLLTMKIGSICFTYDLFYHFLFYSSKLTLISVELAAVAMSYHLVHGIRHLRKDFGGFPFGGRKKMR